MIPEFFKGALGSHVNYLTYIALENCFDYLKLVKQHQEEGSKQTPHKYKRLRYFLNAIDSLNNIPEYFYYEHKASQGWTDTPKGNIIGEIRESNDIIREVARIANASKHCVSKQPNHPNAADLQYPELKILMSSENVELNFDFESIEDEKIILKAFKFWQEYLENPNKELLLQKST
ncbi:hypothetical protein P4E94_19090 [Pontiellaceae bacterium B12219]|nr:hypothetical protein [Pontiellaceae bacterium B12219]